MSTIYIGVDFHARQQTICYLTTETGELVTVSINVWRNAGAGQSPKWQPPENCSSALTS